MASVILQLLAAMVYILTLLLSPPAHAGEEFLEPEKAFRFSAQMVDAGTVEIQYAIASAYYMYRERFDFRSPDAKLGAPVIPPGKVKFDETFAKNVETYRGILKIRMPVQASGEFKIIATAQGCADSGLCYSPMESVAQLNTAMVPAGAPAPGPASGDQEAGVIESSLNSGKLVSILPLFLLLGLGLAFTPCVLPMVPILSSIIVGDRHAASRGRGLLLSGAYALGMSMVYTLLGVAAGLAGEGLAAALQNPWVLGTFGLLMVGLSLSMFGLFQMQMPAVIQSRLMQASHRQAGGKLGGVFVMGALSALIVGPCVAAPLAGVLVYISHTRDVGVGASALFAMAVGMSVPLLLVGGSAGALLPRAGAWMESVKRFFGVLMLASALWIVSPVIPSVWQMAGWSALAFGYAAWLFSRARGGWPARAVALAFAALGLVQLAGLATGSRDPLAPLSHLGAKPAHATQFKRIHSVGELDQVLSASAGKTVMLDFYADWCVSC
ncbi:protein-disulfide reductase DsbD, partial [Lacisediminimonas sp.]|uniref:protein-disulfide reductase DsbD n=1 Tax=Lacisediminimonas sp. TaxID=3060582 RepID=UPI00272CAC5C